MKALHLPAVMGQRPAAPAQKGSRLAARDTDPISGSGTNTLTGSELIVEGR